MDLYLDLLVKILAKGEVQIHFSGIDLDVNRLICEKCYQALSEIKKVIEDDTLEDPECFTRIEKIVCVLEALGSNGGTRHDFG